MKQACFVVETGCDDRGKSKGAAEPDGGACRDTSRASVPQHSIPHYVARGGE